MKVKKYLRLVMRICNRYNDNQGDCPGCPLHPHCGHILSDHESYVEALREYKKNKKILKKYEKGIL